METATVDLTETQIDNIRQAGVRRGINASIARLENVRDLHATNSSAWWELNFAITTLLALTVAEAEEI